MEPTPARPTYGYCPDCFHVVSLKETTCRHCGCQYAPKPMDRLLAAGFELIVFATVVAGMCVALELWR